MFETSRDLLNIILAFSALWLTFFISWLLFYVIMILKNAHDLIKTIREKLNIASALLAAIKDKLDSSASMLTLLMQSIGKIVEYVIEKQGEKPSFHKKHTRQEKTPKE